MGTLNKQNEHVICLVLYEIKMQLPNSAIRIHDLICTKYLGIAHYIPFSDDDRVDTFLQPALLCKTIFSIKN